MHSLMIEVDAARELMQDALSSRASADTLLVLDIGKQERFLNQHLPGALNITPAQTQHGSAPQGLMPPPQALQQLFNDLGLQPSNRVLVYDDEGGGWAGRFIWLLDEIGHQNYHYINGGLAAWKAMGYPIETGSNQPAATASLSKSNTSASGRYTVTLDEIQRRLNDPSFAIWDARSPQEFRGEKINAAKGGHIPGAVNYEWTDAIDTDNDLRLRPLADICRELTSLGLGPEKDIVTHCQSHHRSGLSYLIAKLLAWPNIRAYAGSWGEWGNHPTTPTES